MNIQKERWLVTFGLWIDQFELACDLLNIVPAIPTSHILGLYHNNWRPLDAATLLLSWSEDESHRR